MQVEEAEHAELEWRVVRPVWVAFGDGDSVDVVQDQFHGEEADEESNGI